MQNILSKSLSMPMAAYVLAGVTLLALGFALLMQFGFGFEPCILCLWQRVPFVVTAVLALIAAFRKPFGHHTRVLLALCALAMFINTGLASFHTGVERHWWLGTEGCAIEPMSADASPESIREKLMHTVVARCDEISWTFLGLSMANYNVPFTLSLGVFALMATLRFRPEKRNR